MSRKRKSGMPLPTLDVIAEAPQDEAPRTSEVEVEIAESDSSTVAGTPEPPDPGQVEWITISVPVYTGEIGGSYQRDRFDARLIGNACKEACKRLLLGLSIAGAELSDGRQCRESTQDAGRFLMEAMHGKLKGQ